MNRHPPAYDATLFGRGDIALSKAGRQRFAAFPELLADDLFLDSLFAPGEKVEVDHAVCVVNTARSTRELVRRLAQVGRANEQFRVWSRDQPAHSAPRPVDRWAWLRDVVVPRPWLAPAGVVYATLTGVSQASASRHPLDRSWGPHENSR